MEKKRKISHSESKATKKNLLPKLPNLPPIPTINKQKNNSKKKKSPIPKKRGRKRKRPIPKDTKQQNYVKKLKQKKKRKENQEKLQKKVIKEVMIPVDSGTFENCTNTAKDRVDNIKKSLVDLKEDLDIIQRGSKDYMTIALKTIKTDGEIGESLGKTLAGYAKIILNDLKINKQEIARLHGMIISMKRKVTDQQYLIEKMSENLDKIAPRFVATQHEFALAAHNAVYDPEYIAITEGGFGICPSELND
jgi:hypothetical protein